MSAESSNVDDDVALAALLVLAHLDLRLARALQRKLLPNHRLQPPRAEPWRKDLLRSG